MKHFLLIFLAFLCTHSLIANNLDTLGITIEIDTSAIICQGEEFMGYDEPGIYVDTHISNDTCTITTLELSLYDTTPDVWELMCIEANDPDNTVGTYTTSLFDSNGCEYLHRTVVAVQHPDIEATSFSLCEGESYTIGDSVITQSGTYLIEFNDMGPCPYYATLIATVLPIAPDIITDIEICEGESYSWFGNIYFSSGTYSIPAANCESDQILNLTVLPLSDSNCTTSTKELEPKALSLYPIPTSNILNIEYHGAQSLTNYKCYNFEGALVQSGELSNTNKQIITTSQLTAGMYLMRLLFADGQEMDKRVVIIR